jgi:hypothetical protein
MNKSQHRTGVSEVTLVARHLKLESAQILNINNAVEEIDQLKGLDGVSFDEKSQVLNIAYDATQLNIDDIEKIILKYGLEVSHDWWTHFKESYYRFVDENVKDNSKTVSHCCSKPPAGANRKK